MTAPRYLLPLPSPETRARLFLRATIREGRDRALVAAKLATGFRATSSDDLRMTAATAAIRAAAITAAEVLAATMPSRTLAAAVDVAVKLQRAITAADDAACVGVVVVRALLDDAPDRCVDLDRAVRDAARLHAGSITEAHEATASRIVAEVGL